MGGRWEAWEDRRVRVWEDGYVSKSVSDNKKVKIKMRFLLF